MLFTIPVLLALALTGCSVPRVDITGEVLPFSADARSRLGMVGIVPGSATNVSLVKPMSHGTSTLAGMGAGVVATAEAVPSDPIALVLAVGVAVIAMPIGGTIGYFQGMPADQIEKGEQELRKAIAEIHVEDLVCRRILQNLTNGPYRVMLVTNTIPNEPQINTALNASLLTIGLKGERKKKAPLQAWISCRVRLVRTADGAELFARDFLHEGGEWTFTEWSANGARAFRQELDAGATMLAHDIVQVIFSGQEPVRKSGYKEKDRTL